MALKRKTRVEPQFSLAAMIDIVFLLLMFFMLTSKFVTPNALNLQLPSSSATTMASPNLAVSIKRNGSFYLDDGVKAKKISKSRLMSGIKQKMIAQGKSASETTVTVVAELGTPIEDVVHILDIANKLGVKTILATNPEKK